MSAPLGDRGAEPDLTPILDMVFQLITFFMLVINFQGAALDQKLQLPILGSARPLDTKGQEDLLVLNIAADGTLKVYGFEREVGPYIAQEERGAGSQSCGTADHRRHSGRQVHPVQSAERRHRNLPAAWVPQVRPQGHEQGGRSLT
jgi:hypothetical protein